MSRTLLRHWVLGCLLLAVGCLSEPGQKTSPVIDENALPARPDTSGLRSRPRDSVPGQPPAKMGDTLLPEIALEGAPRSRPLPIDKF